MHAVRRSMLFLLLLGLSACSGSQPPEFGKDDAEVVKKLVQDFGEAYNAKNATKIKDLFSGQAMLMPPNSSTLRGQDMLEGFYSTRFGDGATGLELEVREVNGQGMIAVLNGAYNLQTPHERGKFMWTARNMGSGNWKLESQIWNSDLPVAAAPPPAETK